MTVDHRVALVLSGILLAAAGCSEGGLEKVVVRGKVTCAGEPIPHGQIRFRPVEGTKGPVSGGVIKDGQYVAEGKGGVPLGQHRVEIQAYRPVNSDGPAAFQAEGDHSEQYLPGKYNRNSILEVTITAESGAKSIDFDLEP